MLVIFMTTINSDKLKIEYVPLSSLRHPEKNPRKWTKEATEQLKESITRFGITDPLIINKAPGREGIILGGNFRAEVLKQMKIETVPTVGICISDPQKEAELIIRLNKNTGEFDLSLLAEFDESILKDIGFSSEELDEIFDIEENPEVFDLQKELAKLDITSIDVKEGDVYKIGDSIKVMCGNSMVEADVLKLMDGEKADMCFTDPPYILDYLHGKKKHKSTEGFGYKRDRKYLGTDSLPENFTELWMANIAKIQKPDFSIIIFENPKNLRAIWNAMEKYWKYRNTITWHLPNRTQGFSAKYKFFNKQDIALVGTQGNISLNTEPEEELFQQEYENALFATSGKPHWEGYNKGQKYCPSDFIEFKADDAKHSGQGLVFGTKPVEILIPYLKVLTKRNDLIVEPFGGSGSTGAAAIRMKRRCFLMEKSPVYTTVILRRLSKLLNIQPKKLT